MKKNQKTIAVLTALSTLIATTGCSEEQIRQEYETEKEKVYEDFDEKLAKQQDEIVRRVVSELQGTTAPVFTTTYDAQVTTGTTIGTTAKQTTTTVAAEKTIPSTTRTHITRSSVPAKYTTTTTVSQTTVVNQNTILEPEFVENSSEFEISLKGYTVSNEYIVKGIHDTVSCKGEGLYSIVYKLNGKYDDAIAQEIKKANDLTEDFVEMGTKLKVPFTVIYFKGQSLNEISSETNISKEIIEKLNEIDNPNEKYNEPTNLIIQVLDKDATKFKDMYGQTVNVLGDIVIRGDHVVECGNTFNNVKTSLLTFNKTAANRNVVEYMEIDDNYNCKGCILAENVEQILSVEGNPVLQCVNEGLINSLRAGGHNTDEYKTKIYNQKFSNTYYMYKDNNGHVIVSMKEINMPGYECYKEIGGNQKTK